MRTMAAGWARSCAPVIYIRAKAGGQFYHSCFAKGDMKFRGCLPYPRSHRRWVAEVGDEARSDSTFRTSWLHCCSPQQHRHQWALMQMHAAVLFILFSPLLFLLLFCISPNPDSPLQPHPCSLCLSLGWEMSPGRLSERWIQDHTTMCLIPWAMWYPLGFLASLIIPLLTSGVNN